MAMTKSKRYALERFVKFYGRTICQAYKKPSEAKQRIWNYYADKPHASVVASTSHTFSVAYVEDGKLHWATAWRDYEFVLDVEDKEWLRGQGIYIV